VRQVGNSAAFDFSQILDSVLKTNKATGACKPVQHKDAINAEDKARLQTYFADVLETNDTYKLQSFCFYNLAIHFGLRGGEVFAKLRKSDVEFRTGALKTASRISS